MFELFFYLFSANLLLSAAALVWIKNPVKAVVLLIYCFFSAACLWVLLNADYLALILVLVYVGAVMVLFIFIMMMLNTQDNMIKSKLSQHTLFIGGLIAVLAVQIGGLLFQLPHNQALKTHEFKTLGVLMYEQYMIEVQIAALLLLSAMIAAIVLSIQPSRRSLKQNSSNQIQANPKDRLRLVKMKAQLDQKQDKAP